MKLEFDNKGHLKPYDKITVELIEFEDFFIKNFQNSLTRSVIFDDYLSFIHDFQNEVTPNFTHWINGSFVTRKINPNDIDFVIFLDYELYLTKKTAINQFFAINEFQKNQLLDIYFVVKYPENHKDAFKYVSDIAYWYNWFSKTKSNRQKERFSKGFIEIIF